LIRGKMTERWFWVLMVMAGSLLGSGTSQAQNRCPWLNVATASGVLNGPASLEVEKRAANETVCLFRYQKEGTAYLLQISVRAQQDVNKGYTLDASQCTSAATQLRAIGNEAILCADDRKDSHGDEVIGRVRDSLFTVAISTSSRNDQTMTREALGEKAQSIAEQVAGALF
jgi:hypothetical protein